MKQSKVTKDNDAFEMRMLARNRKATSRGEQRFKYLRISYIWAGKAMNVMMGCGKIVLCL